MIGDRPFHSGVTFLIFFSFSVFSSNVASQSLFFCSSSYNTQTETSREKSCAFIFSPMPFHPMEFLLSMINSSNFCLIWPLWSVFKMAFIFYPLVYMYSLEAIVDTSDYMVISARSGQVVLGFSK